MAIRNGIRGICLLLLASTLTGCAAGRQLPLYSSAETARTFGYAEERTGEASYEVTYVTPERRVSVGRAARRTEIRSLSETAEEVAQLRAAELALEQGYPAFRVTDRRTDAEVLVRRYDTFGPAYASPFFYPRYVHPLYGYYDPFYGHPFGYPGAFGHPGPFLPEAYAQVQATLDVEMTQSAAGDAVAARDVRERLWPKYAPEEAAADEPEEPATEEPDEDG